MVHVGMYFESKANKEMKEVLELVKKMLGDAEAVIESEVKPDGNSAHVPIPKKYLGQMAQVIIKKKKGEEPPK